jgi:diphthine-ammonia ligase
MRLASLVSGGKDSLYAAYLAKKAGHSIDFLLAMLPENKESYMFHAHNLHLLENISELMDIPLLLGTTKGEKEEELDDLKLLIGSVKNKVDGITTGAIASNYQKSRIDKICQELSLKSIAPFWGKDPEATLRQMIRDGFEIIIVSVAAPPLDEKWLGKKIDEKCIDELIKLNKKFGIHLLGEGGEYDTLVTNCPLYSKRIVIEKSKKHWDAKTKSGSLAVKKIRLAEKV